MIRGRNVVTPQNSSYCSLYSLESVVVLVFKEFLSIIIISKMSSVKSRILQFQQNETNDSGTTQLTNTQSNISTNNSRTSLFPSSKFPDQVTRNSVLHDTSRDTLTQKNSTMSQITTPPIRKKTTMTVNFSSGPIRNEKPLPSPNRPAGTGQPRTPSTSVGVTSPSGIPKLIPVPMVAKVSEVKTNLKLNNDEKLYNNMDWKDKYEEAEKKRLLVLSLAQKAARDYEELRRRYQTLCGDHETVVQKFNNSTKQLDALRKASEAAYDDYYKLKKHYHAENSAKSNALNRVDEYHKENRRLKRQSAALMQHLPEGGDFDLEQLIQAGADNPEDDKEIKFLRARVEQLEVRVVDLESELERTKLAEFESQESAMLINDNVQSSLKEATVLKNCLRDYETQNEDLSFRVNELKLELEFLKSKHVVESEKLQVAEAELRKVQTEKAVLQRQSIVFLSNTTQDAQFHDALNQINDLQFQIEEQKLKYETQIIETQERLHQQDSRYEVCVIETEAKVKSLENLVDTLRKRTEEAEKKLEENVSEISCSPIPPPPPPPLPPMNLAPPPPPPPPNSLGSIQSATLRRVKKEQCENSSGSPSPPNGTVESKLIIQAPSTQIDDVVSQIKKGIKLRSTEGRSMCRKETETGDNKAVESFAIEEMRSILNNLKRTKRLN